MKKILSVMLAILMVASLAACGGDTSSEDKIIAEGTGQAVHGYTMDVLYQEYASGKVDITLVFSGRDEGKGNVITYTGNVVKGTDEDGDPIVTVTVDETPTYLSNSEIGEAMNYAYGPQTTNTYDEDTGAYSIPMSFSMFGYADLSASIDVVATDAPTDAAAWVGEYGMTLGE